MRERARRMLRALSGRTSVATAPALTREEILAFKQSAWQSREKAASYHASTLVPSYGMQLEEAVSLRYLQGRILDVGAGTGRFSRCLAGAGHQVVALDVSTEMLRVGRGASPAAYSAVQASALRLPFGDGVFDGVLGVWLLLHFTNWRDILAEMLRVLRPGGLVVFEIQNAANRDLASALSPTAPCLRSLNTREGFHAFATVQQVRDALASRASVVMARAYDTFTDNFVAQVTLGDRYPAWINEMHAALADEGCREYWAHVEERVLPVSAMAAVRKILIVAQKDGADVVPAGRAPCDVPTWGPAVVRSRELFLEAFGAVVPDIANVLPGAP